MNVESKGAEVDIQCTLQSNANVLLTGPIGLTRAVARRVHDESGWRNGGFTVIDCTRTEGLEGCLVEGFAAPPAPPQPHLRLSQDGTVLLEEVGRIPFDLQGKLAELLAAAGERRRRRVIASTTEWLLQRVVDGTFDDRLFYRLNAIHLLLVRTPGGQAGDGPGRRSFHAVRPDGYSSRSASVG